MPIAPLPSAHSPSKTGVNGVRPLGQLNATFNELSGSSWPKQR